VGVVVVIPNFDVLETEVVNGFHRGVEFECGKLKGLPGDLQPRLLEVVEVEVAISPGPDELPRLEVADLRHHAGKQAVGGDVEWHSEKGISATLVQLAREPPVVDVELEEGVARHQRHLLQFANVPCGHDDSTAVGVAANLVDCDFDLVDYPSVIGLPLSPLFAVDGPEFALLIDPFVPDPDLVVLQIAYVGVSREEPQQLVDDAGPVHPLRGHDGKSIR